MTKDKCFCGKEVIKASVCCEKHTETTNRLNNIRFIFEKVKKNGEKIVYSAKELAKYYRAGRIQGDLIEYIESDVAKNGYTLCTNHSSINGENVWYFKN